MTKVTSNSDHEPNSVWAEIKPGLQILVLIVFCLCVGYFAGYHTGKMVGFGDGLCYTIKTLKIPDAVPSCKTFGYTKE